MRARIGDARRAIDTINGTKPTQARNESSKFGKEKISRIDEASAASQSTNVGFSIWAREVTILIQLERGVTETADIARSLTEGSTKKYFPVN